MTESEKKYGSFFEKMEGALDYYEEIGIEYSTALDRYHLDGHDEFSDCLAKNESLLKMAEDWYEEPLTDNDKYVLSMFEEPLKKGTSLFINISGSFVGVSDGSIIGYHRAIKNAWKRLADRYVSEHTGKSET